MKYPCLISKASCSTGVDVTIYSEELSEMGAPIIVVDSEPLKCNYQDCAKTIVTKDKTEVAITGIAMFRGDIVPSAPTLSAGVVVVNGEKRKIASGRKARNIDGTVNYTKLELM